jgi:hypothetical protein
MAKEISISEKEDQAFEDNEHAQFATDVIKLYGATIAGKLADHGNADSDDVRSVAFGLATLKQAVDYFLQRCPDELVAAHGLHHANAILEALTTPGMHPVWRHIKALQGRKYMPHLAPDVATIQTIRDMLGGIVLAYKEASGVDSVLKAAEAVADGIKPAAFKFSADQARKWASRETREATREGF